MQEVGEIEETLTSRLVEAGIEDGGEIAKDIGGDLQGVLEEGGVASSIDTKSADWITDIGKKNPDFLAKMDNKLGNRALLLADDAPTAEIAKSAGVSSETATEFEAAVASGTADNDLMTKVEQEIDEAAAETAEKSTLQVLKDSVLDAAERMKKGLRWLAKKVFTKKGLFIFLLLGGVGAAIYVVTKTYTHDNSVCNIKGAAADANDCTKITNKAGGSSSFKDKICSFQATPKTCTNLKNNTFNSSANLKGTRCSFKTFPLTSEDCNKIQAGLGGNSSTFVGNCCSIQGTNEDTCKNACLASCDGKEDCYQPPSPWKILECLANPACFFKNLFKGPMTFLHKYMWIIYILCYVAVGVLVYRVLNMFGLFGRHEQEVKIKLEQATEQPLMSAGAAVGGGFDMMTMVGQGISVAGIGLLLHVLTTGEYNQLSGTQKEKETFAYPPATKNPMAWGVLIAVLLLSLLLGSWQGASSQIVENGLLNLPLQYFGGIALVYIGATQLMNTQQLKQTAGVDKTTSKYNPIYFNLGAYGAVLPIFAYLLGVFLR